MKLPVAVVRFIRRNTLCRIGWHHCVPFADIFADYTCQDCGYHLPAMVFIKCPPCKPPKHGDSIILCILASALVGCASTDQAMTAPPESHIVVELRGVAPSGPIVVVVNAQIGVTAKPVGLDVMNPATSAAAALNSPNAKPTSGHVGVDKTPVSPLDVDGEVPGQAPAKGVPPATGGG